MRGVAGEGLLLPYPICCKAISWGVAHALCEGSPTVAAESAAAEALFGEKTVDCASLRAGAGSKGGGGGKREREQEKERKEKKFVQRMGLCGGEAKMLREDASMRN